jgi:hypothetical protein
MTFCKVFKPWDTIVQVFSMDEGVNGVLSVNTTLRCILDDAFKAVEIMKGNHQQVHALKVCQQSSRR